MQFKFTDNKYKEFAVNLEDEEVQYMVEFAIAELLKRGVLSFEEPTESQVQLKYLDKLDKENLPRS